MNIITWNVNSLRVRLPRVLALLHRHQPDVLCLQETKVADEEFPRAALEAAGYAAASFGQRTYNGVALLSRRPLHDVQRGFAGDPLPEQSRVMGAECEGLRILNLYVVNGEAVDSPKYPLKLAWMDAFQHWLAAHHRPEQPLLLLGDFNVAPEERDVHDPERWRGHVLFSDPERARVRALLQWGVRDLLRLHSDAAGLHTWWDYRMGAFHRGWGLRIDLALGTDAVAQRCSGVAIDREERKPSAGEGKPSDHAPVIVTLR